MTFSSGRNGNKHNQKNAKQFVREGDSGDRGKSRQFIGAVFVSEGQLIFMLWPICLVAVRSGRLLQLLLIKL